MQIQDERPISRVGKIDFSRAKSRRDIIHKLSEYFALPENVQARNDRETAREAAERVIGGLIESATPAHIDFDDPQWPDIAWEQVKLLMGSARQYDIALDGLKLVMAKWLRATESRASWVQEVSAQLLDGSWDDRLKADKKQFRGNSGTWHKATQVVHAIDQLRESYTALTLAGNGEPDSVYTITAEAAQATGFHLEHHSVKKIYDRSNYRQRELWKKINDRAKSEGLAMTFCRTDWVNAKK